MGDALAPRVGDVELMGLLPGTATGLLFLVALAGCGQDSVCAERDAVAEDVADLSALQLTDQNSLNDLDELVSELRSDLGDLTDAAGDAYESQIDDLDSALSDLGASITGIDSSGSITDAATQLAASVGAVGTAAGDLISAVTSECD